MMSLHKGRNKVPTCSAVLTHDSVQDLGKWRLTTSEVQLGSNRILAFIWLAPLPVINRRVAWPEKHLSGLLSAESLAHAGETLLSGSDDTLMGVWDVERRRLRCSVRTGHTANIFCTKHMPATGERPSVIHVFAQAYQRPVMYVDLSITTLENENPISTDLPWCSLHWGGLGDTPLLPV